MMMMGVRFSDAMASCVWAGVENTAGIGLKTVIEKLSLYKFFLKNPDDFFAHPLPQ
jgi:hypothetical protein